MTDFFSIGDTVSAIDDAIDGVIVAIENNKIVIETKDGFSFTYSKKELVKTSGINELVQFSKNDVSYKKQIDTALSQKQKNTIAQLEKVEHGVPEFDLHIEKLVKNKNHLSNYEILTIQTDTAKHHIEFAIKNRIPKIVLIHGVGEGVLKSELDFLYKKYDQIIKREANYQKYGLGATELHFKQNK